MTRDLSSAGFHPHVACAVSVHLRSALLLGILQAPHPQHPPTPGGHFRGPQPHNQRHHAKERANGPRGYQASVDQPLASEA